MVPFSVADSAFEETPVLTDVGGSVVTAGDSAAIAFEMTVVFSQSVVAWLHAVNQVEN